MILPKKRLGKLLGTPNSSRTLLLSSESCRTFVRISTNGKWMNRRLHNWMFSRLTGRIEDEAREAGILVRKVNSAYTS